ncbi:MAG: DUF58 domain-containing protein [Bifidobacteriaceae bacterium]|jgi:uncharacterized protein (DUF58 family)|nr:DUF58 domain-containing protein [Bifidobacteriaceae bacterium]
MSASHLDQVHAKITLYAHRRVRTVLDGNYASIFKGRSMEFEDLREYTPGDDVSDIDWKATARSGKVLVRRYIAERKNNVTLLVNTGRSMAATAPDGSSKAGLALMAAGVFGYLVLRHRDLMAMAWGDESGYHILPPKGARGHVEMILSTIAKAATPEAAPADLNGLLGYASRAVTKRGIVVLISDDAALEETGLAALKRLHAQHEVLMVSVADMDPSALTAEAPQDIETGVAIPDAVRLHPEVKAEQAAMLARRRAALTRALGSEGIAEGRIESEQTMVHSLISLLERHQHAGR